MEILNRGNDLNEFFIPILFYIKHQILKGGGIPLWNTLFFSGTPLLPDPQNLFIYPLNILFLFFNINEGIIISILIHTLISFFGFYLLTQRVLSYDSKYSKIIAILFGILYSVSPKLFGYLEAGHLGLLQSWAFIPWVYLGVVNLSNKITIKWTFLIILFLYFIYSSHILVFLILNVSAFLLLCYLNPKQLKYLIFINLILFVLISPILIPQLKWQGQTTRDLLLIFPETYPIWTRKLEFLKNIFVPTHDTEKNITLGITVIYLSLWGFLKSNKKIKFFVLVSLFITTTLSLNILTFDWFIKFRVATRFWFPAIVIFLLLAAQGLNYLVRKHKIYFILGLIALLEYLAIGKFVLDSPIKYIPPTPSGIINFLKNDDQIYRVFCLNKCIRQIDAAINNIELVEGYGTLQQKNYFDYSQQLAQSYWDKKYTLSLPPYQNYIFEKLKPYPPSLAAYRVKYIISPYELDIINLNLITIIDNYFIYKNELFKNPNYKIYKPNFIRVETDIVANTLIIPEVYSPGWIAYLNGKRRVEITESPDKTRSVKIDIDTNFVDFIYQPFNFFGQ